MEFSEQLEQLTEELAERESLINQLIADESKVDQSVRQGLHYLLGRDVE